MQGDIFRGAVALVATFFVSALALAIIGGLTYLSGGEW